MLILATGYQPPVPQQQSLPGSQKDLNHEPQSEHVPTEDGGYQKYKAAGKLEGKKALITGGDSGIGRAIAILFAMEGADSYIAYLKEEQEDAEETRSRVEKYGRKCYLKPTDLRKAENCKEVVEDAIKQMGTINCLVNNHAVQMTKDSIFEISEEQWENTFQTNIHRTPRSVHCLAHEPC